MLKTAWVRSPTAARQVLHSFDRVAAYGRLEGRREEEEREEEGREALLSKKVRQTAPQVRRCDGGAP